MDRIHAMQAFARVVEAGSFTRAAHIMELPKTTISRLVQSLETSLGLRLLQRNTRAMTLTAEGEAYYNRLVGVLADLEELESTARGNQATLSGSVRVELGTSMAADVVVPALPQFYRQYPGLQLALCVGNGDMDMVGKGIDCAVRIGPVVNDSLVGRVIGHMPFTTCASPAYLQRCGVPQHPDDLVRHAHQTVGLVFSHLGPKALPFDFRRGEQSVSLPLQPGLEMNDTHACVAAAVSGLGVVQLPAIAAAQALRCGDLVAILGDWAPSPLPVRLLYPSHRFLSAKVRVFMDWLIELTQEHDMLGSSMRHAHGMAQGITVTRRGSPSPGAAAFV